jgi:hypothetical protein
VHVTALITTAKVLTLVACVTVLPFWLAIGLGVPVLYAVGGSVALAILLAALWTQGRRGA